MAKWEFNANDYAEQPVDENAVLTMSCEEEEEPCGYEHLWTNTDNSQKSDTWDDFTGKSYRQLSPSEKIDRVIECLVAGIDDDNVRMTREEIGRYLLYSNPAAAVAQIHFKHSDALDPLSYSRVTSGNLQTRDKVFYSPDGVYEIMCLSAQARSAEFFRRFLEAVKEQRRNND